ncbi:MAG: hypothetical protein IJH37_10760 [Clostridia bacterium]|nr:hypothetical protein [Clostridia bacterium]
MRAYIISVAGAAVLSAVINMMSPERWSKYIGVLTGLVVAVSVGRPIFSLIDKDAFSRIGIESGTVTAESGTRSFYDEINKELGRRIEGDIKERLLSEFGADCEAKAELSIAPNGQVDGVRRIIISGGHLDNIAEARLREIYGAEEVIINGSEKLYQKPE